MQAQVRFFTSSSPRVLHITNWIMKRAEETCCSLRHVITTCSASEKTHVPHIARAADRAAGIAESQRLVSNQFCGEGGNRTRSFNKFQWWHDQELTANGHSTGLVSDGITDVTNSHQNHWGCSTWDSRKPGGQQQESLLGMSGSCYGSMPPCWEIMRLVC